jgi:glycosyltransferase involved in cell wall biosynthesis
MSSKKKLRPAVRTRIRVLRIIARMNIGGPAVQIFGLLHNLDKNTFEQVLITGECEIGEIDYLKNTGSELEATYIVGLGRSVKFWGDIKSFVTLCRLIRQFKPDIIHTHTAKAGVLGRIAGLIASPHAARIHTFHGHLLSGYFGRVKLALVILIEKLLALISHTLLTVGQKVRDDLVTAGIGKIDQYQIISPGLEFKNNSISEVEDQFNRKSPGSVTCFFVGRVTKVKRLDRLIDVARKIQFNQLNIEIVIVGDGPLLPELQFIAQTENLPVQFLGWQLNVESIMNLADMVVITSDNEGTPLSLIQAGVAGKPVVATRVGSVEEIVQNGITGIVCDLNTDSIFEAIKTLAEDPKLRILMGINAKRFCLEHFTAERLASDLADLYSRIFHEKNG